MKSIAGVPVVLWLLCVVCSGAVAQNTTPQKADDSAVVLRYHFHANDVRNVRMLMEQKIKQEIQGQEMTLNQVIGFGYRIDVVSVDDKGNATAKLTYTSVRYKIDNPGGSIDYDSTQPGATQQPGTEAFAGLLNQALNVKFAPDGAVLQVDGVDAMLKHMFASMSVTDESRASMEKAMQNQFGDKAIKQMFEQVTRIYPDQAVKVGGTWSRHAELEKGVAMIMDNTYTLTERNKGVSYVTVKSVCKPNPKAPALEMGPLKIGYELSGQMDGKMEVDEATGWPRRSKITQKLTGKMHMTGQQLPQGMTVPITIDSITTATIE